MLIEGQPNIGAWRTRRQRYRLEAEVCNTCNETIFPPRDICPYCAPKKQEIIFLSKDLHSQN
ncbi:MAG: zinc ribbon domain-containing protein [Candidatus Shapirobacteria bacterium]